MNTKKKVVITVVVLLVIIAIAVGAVIAIRELQKPEEVEGAEVTVKLVSASGSVLFSHTKTTDADTLEALIYELNGDESLNAKINMQDSSYGKYIVSFVVGDNTYGNELNGEYVVFYSSISDTQYSTTEWTMDVDGVTYYSAMVGVSQMPIQDNQTYIFTVISY